MRHYTIRLLALFISIAWLPQIVSAEDLVKGYKAALLPLPEGYVWAEAYDSFQSLQVGRGGGPATDGETHAILWDSEASNLVDLHPDGYEYSFAGSIYGENQVGWVGGPSPEHAVLWRGTAESMVDLHPAGFHSSQAYGVSESNQVGWANPDRYVHHAMIWSGTADSYVDLNPESYSHSRAYEVSDNHQVGYAIKGGERHAAFWEGTAESFVNLNPAGFHRSFARSVEGDYQVGSGALRGSSHSRALLWQGSANSVVDLHPPGYASSSASDVYGSTQVGFGIETYSAPQRALLWHGSAESYVDLHKYVLELDPSFQGSFAHDIEPNGDVFGIVWSDTGKFAVKWTLVPEPGAVTLLLCGIFFHCLVASTTLRSETSKHETRVRKTRSGAARRCEKRPIAPCRNAPRVATARGQ